jgi:lipid A ethanolaminephosphotransferase
MLVDESIRADYIDWEPGNAYTPELASLKDRLIDYGPAASSANCSHTANAILRLLGAPKTLVHTLQTGPTIWQYAKKAGYYTVYVDAQAGQNKDPGKLQNYMTLRETQDIDEFYALDRKIPAAEADYRLLEIVLAKLKPDQPVFIYANKNGAHFPYDSAYPASEAIFHPTMTAAGGGNNPARVNSYRNSVRWSVDRFFRRFFDAADLSETALIYTSDHGQVLQEGRLPHCTVANPNSREGLVPLFAATGDEGLRARFTQGARQSMAHASHFSIAPTLLGLMGYAESDVHHVYGASLFERSDEEAAFTSGDVFGLFSQSVRWHRLDLTKSYLESGGSAR